MRTRTREEVEGSRDHAPGKQWQGQKEAGKRCPYCLSLKLTGKPEGKGAQGMPLAGSAWAGLRGRRRAQGRQAHGAALRTSCPEQPTSSPALLLLLLGEAHPEGSVTSGHAQTPLGTTDLSGRRTYTPNQKKRGHLPQDPKEMALRWPTIWLDYLYHRLRP